MQNSNYSKNKAEREIYVSPVCNEFFVGAQRIICDSETEKVDEIDGEW